MALNTTVYQTTVEKPQLAPHLAKFPLRHRAGNAAMQNHRGRAYLAQDGLRREKKASSPSRASGPSQQATSSAIE
jgi:hypothetical protein